MFIALIYFVPAFFLWPLRYLFKDREEPSLVVMSLTGDQIFRNSTPLEVVKFFREERFKGDYDSRKIIIECRDYRVFLRKCHKNFVIDVPFYLLTHFLPLRNVLKSVTKNCHELLPRSAQLEFSEIKKQIIDKSIWESYISQRRDELFLATTLSTMINLYPPFTLQKHDLITKIMFWYSTNIKPISFQGNTATNPEYLNHLETHFDRHLVWDLSHKEFLIKFNMNDVRIRGSILFQPQLVDRMSKKSNQILFFDITPLEDAEGFYNEKMSLDTVNSLVNVIGTIKEKYDIVIELLVKPKRKYSSIFSKAYTSRIKMLEHHNYIKLLDPNSNLYKEISKAEIIVCPPFTSPAIIARELNVPVCFFTKASNDWNLPKIENGFEVIRTEQTLMNFVINNLKA